MKDFGEDVLTTAIRFEMFTRTWNEQTRSWEGSMLKAFEADNPDGTKRMMLHGVASSTIKDLHGDTMLESALDDMERAANSGLTIFGNHSYVVPEDDYGHVESAQIRNSGKIDEAGDPIYDLMFDIEVNDENDRAIKTWRSIRKKSKLGLSIGAMIPPGGAVRDKKSGALTISHVELLETSIVGIPANPRSWIENAVRASLAVPVSKSSTSASLGTPQLTLDTETGHYVIEGSIADIAAGDAVSFGFGKTVAPDVTESHNELPDSAFACISPGGHKDADGKTTPRSLRHYPHHTSGGAVDKNLLRNALARYEDPKSPKCGKAHLDAHAKAEGIGDDNSSDKSVDDLVLEAVTTDFDVDHFVALAGGEFSHDHDHAHTHDHEHSHDDGEMRHSHEHSHIHAHGHDHGGTDDHDHDEEMNHPDHDHDHEGSEGDHPHDNDNDSGNEPDGDEDDKSQRGQKAAVCPDCGHGKGGGGGCQNPFHSKDADPDVTDAKVRIIEIDTGDDSGASSQGASGSEPADEDGDVIDAAAADQIITSSRDMAATLDPEVTSQFQLLIDLANGLNRELAASIERERTASAVAEQAERQRDEIAVLCGKLMSSTNEILNKLADQPVGRRAVFREAQEEFSGLEGIYSRDFLTMLRSK